MNLEEFKEKMEKDLRQKFGKDIWVWRDCNGVKGFYGNGVINNAVVIWITERPSLAREKKDKFPDWIDETFYRLLKEEGLENIHLTDFVKIMDYPGKQPTEEEIKVNAEWMKKEIEILKHKDKKLIIIANTRNVERWMRKYIPEYPCLYYEFFKRILRFNKKENRERKLREILREIVEQTKK